eukprot:gnl/MRDRNA2_/MRDRNA2_290693_c0_seq1.p1 gnl/MRDRNA2_/MRDRNA2_290693_c0~~gnl/MRDRNA2_/MRDRNA2_290693_c0_seq1.p1  ORF type:complete len:326 (+),score=36.34 gnl/MRDRNA2_/MRDRNA2_290693_c0_seq1:74-979(+)
MAGTNPLVGARKPRALYMHGTGDPSGSFIMRYHQAALSEYVEWLPHVDMQTSKFDLARKNSALRWLMTYGFFAGLLGGAIASLVGVVAAPKLWPIFAVSGIMVSSCISCVVGRCGFRGSLRGATQLQYDHLKKLHQEGRSPELIVANSFGGAVCARLMAEGKCDCPALLVAPALCHGPNGRAMFDHRFLCKGVLKNNADLCEKILVLQGDIDRTSRPDKVEQWCKDLGIKFITCSGVGHAVFLQAVLSKEADKLLIQGRSIPATPREEGPEGILKWLIDNPSDQEGVILPISVQVPAPAEP